MDYMTLKEAAEKWGVTPRRVNYYCAAGRIPGAVKMAGVWPVSYTHLDVYKRQVLEQLSVQRIHLSKLLVNQSTRLLMCS